MRAFHSSSRRAEGLLTLAKGKRSYSVEVRPVADQVHPGRLQLELHRDDAQPYPVVDLSLDSARTLLRLLQAECDRADRLAYEGHKRAQADAELERVVDHVAKVLP